MMLNLTVMLPLVLVSRPRRDTVESRSNKKGYFTKPKNILPSALTLLKFYKIKSRRRFLMNIHRIRGLITYQDRGIFVVNVGC